MNTAAAAAIHVPGVRRLISARTYRPKCSCGWEGSNMTKSQAERRAEHHADTENAKAAGAVPETSDSRTPDFKAPPKAAQAAARAERGRRSACHGNWYDCATAHALVTL